MKNVLPKYHTVRVALLDSIENQAVQKVTTIAALHTSLRDWLEVLKLAMRRYSLQPEPRRYLGKGSTIVRIASWACCHH
eukprot:4819634-Amphidinium_carterae.1